MTALEIVALIEASAKIMSLAQAAIARGKERGEWTPEQQAEFDALLAAAPLKPHWQPRRRD